MSFYNDHKVSVPEGQSGKWKIVKFTVEDSGAKLHNMLEVIHETRRYIYPGDYTQLLRDNEIIMSDTYSEINEQRHFFIKAFGEVLINGLGLGVSVQACLRRENVSHLTVIEISSDVIKLVDQHYYDMFGHKRLKIIQADALTWQPPKGKRYNFVWHDIWDNICGDNWVTMTKLHRRYGRRCCWQDSWKRDKVRQLVKREKQRVHQ